MPDIYTRVTEAAAPILEGLMGALELRASDPQLRAMLTTYLTDAALPKGARVLEVGCGTGAITRFMATWPGVSAAVGVDPSPAFVGKARELATKPETIDEYLAAVSDDKRAALEKLRKIIRAAVPKAEE